METHFNARSRQQRYPQVMKIPVSAMIVSIVAVLLDRCDCFSTPGRVARRPPDGIFDGRVATVASLSPLFSSTEMTQSLDPSASGVDLSGWKAGLVKAGLFAFLASMCLGLTLTLYPQKLLYKFKLIDRQKKEHWATRTGCFCARWSLRMFPFCRLDVIKAEEEKEPVPSVFACNHISRLDVFMLLATDLKLRGPNRRPIKIIYWKQLEENPFTRLFLRQAGCIPVEMADNGSGSANDYDKSSFRTLLKQCKQAFEDGFDIGILPEGQLNPTPEQGLLPVFTGAYTLAKMSRRPIQLMAVHGMHKIWHGDDSIGVTVTGRDVKVRCYPEGRVYSSPEDFKETFTTVVGQFGATGHDLDPQTLTGWLTGRTWEENQKKRKEEERIREEKRKLGEQQEQLDSSLKP